MFTLSPEYQQALIYLASRVSDLDDDCIVVNSIETPDGTILESKSRHDYVSHTDKNGTTYACDGGLAYLRRGGASDYIERSIPLSKPFEEVREAFRWGSRGPDGKQKFTRLALSEIGPDHLIKLFDYYRLQCEQRHGDVNILRILLMEGAFRASISYNPLLVEGIYLFPIWPQTLR